MSALKATIAELKNHGYVCRNISKSRTRQFVVFNPFRLPVENPHIATYGSATLAWLGAAMWLDRFR